MQHPYECSQPSLQGVKRLVLLDFELYDLQHPFAKNNSVSTLNQNFQRGKYGYWQECKIHQNCPVDLLN